MFDVISAFGPTILMLNGL